MNIQQATRQYEGWLADHVRVVKSDLGTKHELQRQFTKDLDSEALGRGRLAETSPWFQPRRQPWR